MVMSKRAWPVELEPYVVERFRSGASIKEIQRELGGNELTISRLLKRHGLRPIIGSEKRRFTDADLATIRRMWEDGEPVVRIVRALGWSEPTVKRALRELGFEPRARYFRGQRHHHWRGGSTNAQGYHKVMVYPEDPMARMRDKKGYVLEHRLIMARALGRPLKRSETVHHLNGIRDDNRLENLQLHNGHHGRGVALRCAVCGSHDIVFDDLKD